MSKKVVFYNAERNKTLIIDPFRGCGVQFTFESSSLSKINPKAEKSEDSEDEINVPNWLKNSFKD